MTQVCAVCEGATEHVCIVCNSLRVPTGFELFWNFIRIQEPQNILEFSCFKQEILVLEIDVFVQTHI